MNFFFCPQRLYVWHVWRYSPVLIEKLIVKIISLVAVIIILIIIAIPLWGKGLNFKTGFYKFSTTSSNYKSTDWKFYNKSSNNLNENNSNNSDDELKSFLKWFVGFTDAVVRSYTVIYW